MTKYSLEERRKFIQIYYQNGNSFSKSIKQLKNQQQKDPSVKLISDQAYRNLIKKFESANSLEDAKRSGRPKSARTEENIEAVKISVEADPTQSTRKRSSQLNINHRSLSRILKLDLKKKVIFSCLFVS